MKKQYLLSVLCFSLIALLFSCKKDDTPQNTGPTKTELLTTGSWKYSAATVNGVDAGSALQACQKDNIYTFAAAGTGTIDEGPSKCNSSDPQSSPFTWNFLNNETVIHLSTILFSGGTTDFTIVTLTSTQLVVSQNYPPYGVIIITFTH